MVSAPASGGMSAIAAAPTMPITMPRRMILTAPRRSARPPAATMSIPEKRAARETARFETPDPRPSEAWTTGWIASSDWVNSQNDSTESTIPSSHRSVGRHTRAASAPGSGTGSGGRPSVGREVSSGVGAGSARAAAAGRLPLVG